MTHRNARYDSSDSTSPDRPLSIGITRRQALGSGAIGLGALLLAPGWARADSHAEAEFALPEETLRALSRSPLVYVSPLHEDGKESRCHGEVWFMHDRGSVLVATSTQAWKAEALRTGRDRARIWVGDFGPVKKAGDRYRGAPTFMAKATRELDQAVFDRLLETFGMKYADGWEKWEPRFKKGWEDGSRTLIRYTPVGA